MPVMDEFKKEREALKHGTFKEKITYFFDYYKWHALIGAAGAAAACSIIGHVFFGKETALFTAIVNAVSLEPAEAYNAGFAEYAGIDTDDFNLVFDSSYHIIPGGFDRQSVAAKRKLMMNIAANEIDVFLADETAMEQYAYSELFLDLRELLSEEQLEKYSPHFYYMDRSAVGKITDTPGAAETAPAEHPDPRHPEAMDDPVPVGIYLDNAAALKESYYFPGDAIVGVVVNTKRPLTASRYIDYILQ